MQGFHSLVLQRNSVSDHLNTARQNSGHKADLDFNEHTKGSSAKDKSLKVKTSLLCTKEWNYSRKWVSLEGIWFKQSTVDTSLKYDEDCGQGYKQDKNFSEVHIANISHCWMHYINCPLKKNQLSCLLSPSCLLISASKIRFHNILELFLKSAFICLKKDSESKRFISLKIEDISLFLIEHFLFFFFLKYIFKIVPVNWSH